MHERSEESPMRYVFFDTELVDGRCKICEFGYVICDEDFEIIKKKNILINPKGKIKLTNRKGQKDLCLSYTDEEYKKHEQFYWYYAKIKELLTKKDTVVLGYSVDNDVRYLFRDCERYKLPLFDFKVYDIQKILYEFEHNEKKQIGLEKAKQLLKVKEDTEIINHKADDDSLSTLEIIKKMSEELNLSLAEVLELCSNCSFDALPFYLESKEKPKVKCENKGNKKQRKIGHDLWVDASNNAKLQNRTGTTVTISGKVQEDIASVNNILEYLTDKFVPCEHISLSNYFVVFDEEDKQYILTKLKRPYEGIIITKEEFLKVLSEGEMIDVDNN